MMNLVAGILRRANWEASTGLDMMKGKLTFCFLRYRFLRRLDSCAAGRSEGQALYIGAGLAKLERDSN